MRRGFGSPILDTAARLLTPFIILFGLYVLFHGHDSPGGGFQGGTILAAAVLLLRIVRGKDLGWGPELPGALWIACTGMFLYTAIGFVPLAFGKTFLDYSAFPLDLPPSSVRALGSLVVEFGVGLAVFGTMLVIFEALTTVEE